MDDERSNSILIKHSAAVHVGNIFTLSQRKIANILLKNAFHELDRDKWHSMRVKDLLDQLGWDSDSHCTEAVKSDLRMLNGICLEWNILNKDKKKEWGAATFLSDAKLKNGVVFYSFSRSIRDSLRNPNIYARLDLLEQKVFNGKHALVLWELISCEFDSRKDEFASTDWMGLKDVKRIFGLNEARTYASFKGVSKEVLRPSVAEINEKSSISVSMSTKMYGKKVEAVKFVAVRRSKKAAKLASRKRIERSFGEAKALGISKEKLLADIEKYGEERAFSALAYARKQIDSGKTIDNVAAYYSVALRENWNAPVSSDEVKTPVETGGLTAGPEIFSNFMEELKKTCGEDVFRLWFADLKFATLKNDEMTVKSCSKFKKNYLQLRFEKDLFDAGAKVGRRISLA